MENKILIDWLTVTSKTLNVDDFKKLLGMDNAPWQLMKGYYGYKSREYYESISIHYDGTFDMGVCLEMSGQGCRAFESLGNGSFEIFFEKILEEKDLRVTRLDIAFDDHTGILDINQIVSDTEDLKCVVTPFRSWCTTCSNKGKSVDIGSKASSVLIRIYDKAAERGFKDGDMHWVRVEMQLRDSRAFEFLRLPMTIGERFFNVLCNYLCYVTPNENDTNKSRWKLAPYWEELLNSAYAVSIYSKPGMEYNLGNVDNFVFHNAKNAISCALECYGLVQFLEKLKDSPVRPNPKYTNLIDKYKHVSSDPLESVIESSILDNTLSVDKSLYQKASKANEFKRNFNNKKDS